MPNSTIIVTAGLESVSPDHPVAQDANMELLVDLHRELELDTGVNPTPMADASGWAMEFVVHVEPEAGLLAAVKVFRLWLSRDGRRWLILRRDAAGRPVEETRITGDAISDEVVRTAIERVLGKE